MKYYGLYDDFLNTVERQTGKTFVYRKEIIVLLRVVDQSDSKRIFSEMLFYSKFITKAQRLLDNPVQQKEDYTKLASELVNALNKMQEFLRQLVSEMSEENRTVFEPFLEQKHESIYNHLLPLCKDLQVLKNYQLDGGELFVTNG